MTKITNHRYLILTSRHRDLKIPCSSLTASKRQHYSEQHAQCACQPGSGSDAGVVRGHADRAGSPLLTRTGLQLAVHGDSGDPVSLDTAVSLVAHRARVVLVAHDRVNQAVHIRSTWRTDTTLSKHTGNPPLRLANRYDTVKAYRQSSASPGEQI